MSDFALIEAMGAGLVHVGILRASSYILAHEEGAANIILSSQSYNRDEFGNILYAEPLISGYCSQLVVASDSGITSVSDLEGKTIAISAFTSFASFIWPANFLVDNGLDPMLDVTWIQTGSYNASVEAVLNGDVDAAFIYKDARAYMTDQYPDIYDEVIYVLDTELIPMDTISVTPSMEQSLIDMIVQAFLNISNNPNKIDIMRDTYNHDGYAIALDSDYDLLRTYLERQEVWDIE
jgi:phosphonate transport system substrate-binding protein